MGRAEDGRANVMGMPSTTARTAAREKFSTEVADITVDDMQRLKALRTIERGATSSGFDLGIKRAGRQAKAISSDSATDACCACVQYFTDKIRLIHVPAGANEKCWYQRVKTIRLPKRALPP